MNKSIETKQTGRHGTVDFILRRMGRSKGFPAISENISQINRKLSSKDKNLPTSEISRLILRDYALTTRLLKQVNSSFYTKARKPVTTVSRAVVLIGFEQVRIIATSLMLFEHFRGYAGNKELKEAALDSLMSSFLARNLADKLKIDPESAAICAMLHSLGKNLVMLHLQTEYQEIKSEMEKNGLDEQAASKAVLGKTYHELGMEIAKEWNFSNEILASMEPYENDEIQKPKTEGDSLRGAANYSNQLSEIVRNTPKSDRKKALELLSRRYKKFVPMTAKDLQKLLISSMPEMRKTATMLKITNGSTIRKMMADPEAHSNVSDVQKAVTIPGDPAGAEEPTADDPKDPPHKKDENAVDRESESIIINGIQEITNVLAESYTLSDLIAMTVEILYRGLAFNRVVFCTKYPKKPWIAARFGLGNNIKEVLETFSFRISKSPDVFNEAVIRNRDFRIKDANSDQMRPLIPAWYRKAVNAPSFIVYPIFIDNVCLGLLYADREKTGEPVPEKHLTYLKTLRNQLVIGIKQQRKG